MADIRIDSHGFSIGRWHFPPFTLRRGEGVTLCLPKEARGDEDRIISCLTGTETVSGLNLNAKVVIANPVPSRSGWRQWFQGPTSFAWLKKNSTLSDTEIRAFLLEYRMNGNTPVKRLAGNPKMLLGLRAALARRPEVVVFATTALDPIGVRDSFRIVAENLPECSAVYLAWPFSCQGQEQHDTFPGSSCLTVIDSRQPTFAQ